MLFVFSISENKAQELEPRFLSSVPMKTNFSGIVYGFSTGEILLNFQELEDFTADLNTIGVFYGRSFKLLNKPAKIDAVVPYTFGKLNALLSGVDTTVYKNGFVDPTIRLSMILIGDKALTLKEFAKREKKKFKLGAAFKVKFPIGSYDETKLINFGANRWGFQIKVAASYWLTKKLILEYHADSWFFTKNTSFYNGKTVTQEPLFTTQLHIAYLFNPKFWVSASIGQVAWGETTVDNVEKNNDQENSRYGITASYRIKKLGSLKLAITNGLYTTSGNDFTSFLFGYTFLWFDKNKSSKNE